MVEPDAVVTEDIFGDFYVSDEPVNDLTVVVIGRVPSLAALEDLLEGWEDAMLEDELPRAGCASGFPRILEVRSWRVGHLAQPSQGVTRWGSRTRSASLIVVMSGFQLPSIDVAAAAYGVAFSNSLKAFASQCAATR